MEIRRKMTRRDFLRGATLVGVGATVAACAAPAAAPAPAQPAAEDPPRNPPRRRRSARRSAAAPRGQHPLHLQPR